jgi:hypothetical protein
MDREALERELAELEAKNAAATSWGAAVSARHERIKGIRAALARASAQDENGSDQHTFEEAGFDTCRFCGERKRHPSHRSSAKFGPAQGASPSFRDAVDRIIVSAMAWQPSENGPSFDGKYNELMARFDAAARTPAGCSGQKVPEDVRPFIEHLRAWPACEGHDAFSSTYVGELFKDAAQTIELLANQVEASEERFDDIWKHGLDLEKKLAQALSQVEQQQAELSAYAGQNTNLRNDLVQMGMARDQAVAQVESARKQAFTEAMDELDKLRTLAATDFKSPNCQGQRGVDRTDAFFDAYHAIRKLSVSSTMGEPDVG